MKTTHKNLRKNGFKYTQLLRGKRSYLYAQEVSPGNYYYEVFLIKIKPEREFRGKTIPAKEWFPHNEAFGNWAWSYQTYKKALSAFNRLEEFSSVRGW